MAKPFGFNGTPVRTPDTFQPSAATTSTDDSDRTQDLVMRNTPIGTVDEVYERRPWRMGRELFLYIQL